MSEGGLGVAVAEMAFAGDLGAIVQLANIPCEEDVDSDTCLLFSESNSRFLCEVTPDAVKDFEALLSRTHQGQSIAFARVGKVTGDNQMKIEDRNGGTMVALPLDQLKEAWQNPLAW